MLTMTRCIPDFHTAIQVVRVDSKTYIYIEPFQYITFNHLLNYNNFDVSRRPTRIWQSPAARHPKGAACGALPGTRPINAACQNSGDRGCKNGKTSTLPIKQTTWAFNDTIHQQFLSRNSVTDGLLFTFITAPTS